MICDEIIDHELRVKIRITPIIKYCWHHHYKTIRTNDSAHFLGFISILALEITDRLLSVDGIVIIKDAVLCSCG